MKNINGKLEKMIEALDGKIEKMSETFDLRSERWQESEKGDEWQDRLEQMQECLEYLRDAKYCAEELEI